jgi:transposase InsO family protein
VLAVVQDGWKVTEVAVRLGISRQTVHNWIARYEQDGLAALADHSRRPNRCPHQIAADVEAFVCELRREHPGWGPRRIEHQLARSGVDPVPARSSIYRCLKRHGLIELRRRRKRRDEFRRWEQERPMQLWQMDVMGGVELEDGTELKVVTGVDDHSRFCVAAGLVRRATSKAVCEVLAASLGRYGIPDEVLTDNGKCFTRRFGPNPVEVLFDRILRENGISHGHTGVRSPTPTGKIDRFHQSLRKEFLDARTFRSVEQAQTEVDAWVAEYNTARPHQALEMATPAERFRLAPLSTQAISLPVDEHDDQAGQWVLGASARTATSAWTPRPSRWATPSRPSSWTCSSTQPRSRSGARTTSSRRSRESDPDPFGRCVRTGCTSNISRTRSVKHQVELDRGHGRRSQVAIYRPSSSEICQHREDTTMLIGRLS